jgi:hypothetical protein
VRARMGAWSSASSVRNAWTAEISPRNKASWRADRDSDQSRGGATRSSSPKTSNPPRDAHAGRATLASTTNILSVPPPGPPEDSNPIRLRLASPGLPPGLRQWQASRIPSDSIEVTLVDHVLSSDSLGAQLAGTNPATNGFRVAADPISRARHR